MMLVVISVVTEFRSQDATILSFRSHARYSGAPSGGARMVPMKNPRLFLVISAIVIARRQELKFSPFRGYETSINPGLSEG